MRTIINGKKIILQNDTTDTEGSVLSGQVLATEKYPIACIGDAVYCPACQQIGEIIEGSSLMQIQGVPVALEGHKVECGCDNGCRLIAVE